MWRKKCQRVKHIDRYGLRSSSFSRVKTISCSCEPSFTWTTVTAGSFSNIAQTHTCAHTQVCSELTFLTSLFMRLMLCWWELAARRGLGWPVWANFSCEGHWRFDSEFPGETKEVEIGQTSPGYCHSCGEGGRCVCNPLGKAISSPPVRLSNYLTNRTTRADTSPSSPLGLKVCFALLNH